MHRLMPTHRGYSGNRIPPLKILEPLLDKSSSKHWYWNGDFSEDHNMRYASFVWSPPGEQPVFYCVARVVWSHVNNQSLFKKRLRNTCGLTTCVNPAHFELGNTSTLGPVTLPTGTKTEDGTGARLVTLNGHAIVHILRDETVYTACYAAALHGVNTAPEGTIITCPRCITAWRSAQRQLESVNALPGA